MFFWNSLAFSMIQWILAIWSLVPLAFLKPAWTSGSSWFTYYWSFARRILSITFLVHEMSAIVWKFEHSLALPFLGIGMKTNLFQSCGHCWVPKFAGILSTALSQIIFYYVPSPPPALFIVMLPKAHLTLHPRMSGSRWVTTPSSLSGS